VASFLVLYSHGTFLAPRADNEHHMVHPLLVVKCVGWNALVTVVVIVITALLPWAFLVRLALAACARFLPAAAALAGCALALYALTAINVCARRSLHGADGNPKLYPGQLIIEFFGEEHGTLWGSLLNFILVGWALVFSHPLLALIALAATLLVHTEKKPVNLRINSLYRIAGRLRDAAERSGGLPARPSFAWEAERTGRRIIHLWCVDHRQGEMVLLNVIFLCALATPLLGLTAAALSFLMSVAISAIVVLGVCAWVYRTKGVNVMRISTDRSGGWPLLGCVALFFTPLLLVSTSVAQAAVLGGALVWGVFAAHCCRTHVFPHVFPRELMLGSWLVSASTFFAFACAGALFRARFA
jgi:hypothetical protein